MQLGLGCCFDGQAGLSLHRPGAGGKVLLAPDMRSQQSNCAVPVLDCQWSLSKLEENHHLGRTGGRRESIRRSGGIRSVVFPRRRKTWG